MLSGIGRFRCVFNPSYINSIKKKCYFSGSVAAPPNIPGLSGESGYKEFQSVGGDYFIPDVMVHLRKKFGDIARLEVPGTNSVVVFHPEDIKSVYNAEGKYPVGNFQVVFEIFKELNKQIGIPPLLLPSLTGHDWKTIRNIIQKDISPPQAAQSYLPLYTSNVEKLVDRFPTLPRENAFILVSFDLLYKLLHGRDSTLFDGPWETNSWNEWMEKGKLFLPLMVHYGISSDEQKPAILEQLKHIQAFINDKSYKEVIQTINESEKWKDKPVKPYFIKLWERGEANETMWSGGSVSAFIQAALDSTGYSMELLAYNLATHPEAQQKLYNEVASVIQGKITEENLKRLPYLKACIKESYRMNPVVTHNGRVLDNEITLQGYKIPPGVLIQFSGFPYCHDEKIFPDPHVFRPERWLDEKSGNELHNHPYLILPFGVGARMCPGARVAESEMRAFFSSMIYKYEFINETPVPIRLKTIMTNQPDPRPIIKYKPRHH